MAYSNEENKVVRNCPWRSISVRLKLKDKSFKNCLEYTHRVKGKNRQRTEENHENDRWIKWECQ